MPNPFPGMDPYLEGPFWSVVHGNLVEEIARQLSLKLRPKYFALSEERVVIATPDPIELAGLQQRFPDVSVVRSSETGLVPDARAASTSITLNALMPQQVVQKFVEIRDAESRSLVTAIEVLSPTNKRGDGLGEFRRKRLEYLSGSAHYLEIDLLRIGERFPVIGPLPSVPYFVFLSRADRRPRLEAWPIALNQPLPTVTVPLLAADGDTTLELHSAWETIYGVFGYEAMVNHRRPPVVPLSPEQAAWAEECLKRAGLDS